MLSLKNRRNYILLSSFVFFFFFAQAAAISLLSIWLTQKIGLNGVEAGTVFSANFIAAMIAQPIFGYLSDRLGFSRIVPATIAGLVVMTGFFFSFIYAPLLQANVIVGAAIGGIFLGGTYVAGSYAVESYVDRISRREGFEYSRARLWGSLGFASAALFSGRLYNIEPGINFYLASIAGIVLLPLILATRSQKKITGAEESIPKLRPSDSFSVLKLRKFWGFMVLILGVTNLYLVYDQQFPFYFSSQFPTKAEGTAMFGYLNSAQIFIEAGMMFVAPIIVRRTGATYGLLLASGIMIVRIAASAFAIGPITISMCKMLHSLELPILLVSIFRYIAYHFEARLSSTLYLVGVSFGHSLGLALLSPIAGLLYDHIGFQNTYIVIACFASLFWLTSWFTLSPTPAELPRAVKSPNDPAPAPADAEGDANIILRKQTLNHDKL